MSEPTRKSRFGEGWMDPTRNNVILIYILFFIGGFILVTCVIAALSAMTNQEKAEGWLKTHYTWAIRTFWVAVVIAVAAYASSFVISGYYGYAVYVAWLFLRAGIGLVTVRQSKPMARPTSLLV